MFFFRSSSTLLCLDINDAVIRGAVVKARDKGGDVLEKAEVPLADGVVHKGNIENMQAATEAMTALLKNFKHRVATLPTYITVAPENTYTAYIEGMQSMPKDRGLIGDLTSQWLPFSASDIVVQQKWQASLPPALALTALEMKIVRNHRMLLSKVGCKSPVFIPRSYGQIILAYGKNGPKTPSIFLDLTTGLPVMTLCMGNAIIDERLLFGAASNESYCETIYTWIPRLHPAQGKNVSAGTPKSAKEIQKEEKARLKEEKQKAKEEAKKQKAEAKLAKQQGKIEPNPLKSVTAVTKEERLIIATPEIPAIDMDKPIAMPITIFGDETHPFDVSCKKLANVTVVTQYLGIEDQPFAFAQSLAASYSAIDSIPNFS